MSAGGGLKLSRGWARAGLAGAYLFPYMSSAWRPEICGIKDACGDCGQEVLPAQGRVKVGRSKNLGGQSYFILEGGCVQPPRSGLVLSIPTWVPRCLGTCLQHSHFQELP